MRLLRVDLVKSFITHAQNRLGDSVRSEPLENRCVRKALGDFFRLKERWQFSSAKSVFGKYYFSRGEYYYARIDYEKSWGVRSSPFDRILVSLSSDFKSPGEVGKAEAIIEEHLGRFVKAYAVALEGVDEGARAPQ